MNNKMNDFVGITLQNTFYAYSYILLSHTRQCTPICRAAMLLSATGAETSMLLNCILQGWAIIFGAKELLRESSIWRRVVPSYESRSKTRFTA